MEHRVRVEMEIVVVRHLVAARVVELQYGLKPTGNTVGDVGDQLPSFDSDDQTLPLARLKTIPVHPARGELTVHRARHGDAHFHCFRRPLDQSQMLLAEHLFLAGLHRLTGDFGHLVHVKGHRVGDTPFGDHPDLPPAGFCVGGHRDLGKDEFRVGTNGRKALVFREHPLDLIDQVLLCHFFLGQFGTVRCGRFFFRADGRGKLEISHLGGHYVAHRRFLLLQLVELLSEHRELLIVPDPVVIDQPNGNPFSGHNQIRSIKEPLSTQPNREGAALLAAGGIDVTDVLRPGRGRYGQEYGQP